MPEDIVVNKGEKIISIIDNMFDLNYLFISSINEYDSDMIEKQKF